MVCYYNVMDVCVAFFRGTTKETFNRKIFTKYEDSLIFYYYFAKTGIFDVISYIPCYINYTNLSHFRIYAANVRLTGCTALYFPYIYSVSININIVQFCYLVTI